MKNIAKSLAKFHSEMTRISKDATNPFFKSKYASLSNILDAIKEPLATSGLTFTQFPVGENELRTILIDVESGESIEGTFKMTPAKNDPQGQGSVITYQRRYALSSILGLNVDDDDGNAGTHSTGGKFDQKQPVQKMPAKPFNPELSYVDQLRAKIMDYGATTEAEALRIVSEVTGKKFATTKQWTENQAKELLEMFHK